MWFNWFGISKKRYSDIVDEWEKWRPWCTRVSTSFSSAFTVGWMPLDAGRSSSSTDNGFSDDVALIREWRNSNTWNCLCFSIKKQMNSIWNVFWDIKWNVCTWCPVVWFSLPKKKRNGSVCRIDWLQLVLIAVSQIMGVQGGTWTRLTPSAVS
jgi:hypothetical protein